MKEEFYSKMRKFQIDINLHYLDEANKAKELSIYADSNDIWEAICTGFSELVNTLQSEGQFKLPVLGRKEHWRKSE